MMAKVRKGLPVVSKLSPAASWLQNQYSQIVGRKDAFKFLLPTIWGNGGTRILPKLPLNICLSHETFRETEE